MNMLLIKLGAMALLIAFSFGAGWRVHDWKVTAATAKQLELAIKDRDQKQAKLNEVANELEDAKSRLRILRDTVTTEVTKIVERPIYRNECFDDDGLRSLKSAIGRKGVNPAKSASAVR